MVRKTFVRIVLWALVLVAFSAFQEQRDLRVGPTAGPSLDYANSWAVIVGINEYPKAGVGRLNYAVADARAIAAFLVNQAGFDPNKVRLLENEHATKSAIQGLLGDWLRDQTGNQDRLLVFFAGHGETLDLPGGGQMGFLIPWEGDPNRLYQTCISMGEIRNFSDLLPAKHVLFIVDTCYSGIAGEQRRALSAETQGYMLKLVRARGRQILTAGQAGEKVVESDKWGHSLYTYYLLKGLSDGEADLNNDQLVTATELHTYLQPNVSVASQNRQTPQLRYLEGDGEFVFDLRVLPKSRVSRPPERFQPPETIFIKGDRFSMGSEKKGFEDEKPVHEVTVRDFHLGKYEVTNEEFRSFVKETGYQTDAEKRGWSWCLVEDVWKQTSGASWERPTGPGSTIEGKELYPVVHVTYNDAPAYCQWLSRKTGKRYRLPTEAEWEYACRAGTTTEYWWGDSFDRTKANTASYWSDEFDVYSPDGWRKWRAREERTFLLTKVGAFPANPWGLFDTVGNVWEWCSSQYKAYPYRSNDGREDLTLTAMIVLRGGSWYYIDSLPRSARRGRANPTDSYDTCGFRVAH